MPRFSQFFLAVLVLVAIGCDSADPDPGPPPAPIAYSIEGTVSSTLGFPVEGAMVALSTTGAEPVSTTTNALGHYAIEAEAGDYSLFVEKDGYVAFTEALALARDVMIDPALVGDSRIQAVLVDPRDDERTMANVPLRLHYGDETVSVTTDASGALDVEEAPSGTWTINVDGPGIFRGRLEVEAEAGGVDLGMVTVEPVTPPSGYRIELTWGMEPADMDLHVTWRSDPSHFLPNWHCAWYGCGGLEEAIYLGDDFDGEGPETVILFATSDGKYRVSAEAYEGPLPDGYWQSPAQVRVYRGEALLKTYTPPVIPGFDTLWRVFEMTVSGNNVQFNDGNGQTLGYVFAGDESWY